MKRCPQCRKDYVDDSLLYCLDDGAMARMRFETDRHLTPEGHRWAAMALLDILRRTVPGLDPP